MRVFVNKVITILHRLKHMNLYFVVTLSDSLNICRKIEILNEGSNIIYKVIQKLVGLVFNINVVFRKSRTQE